MMEKVSTKSKPFQILIIGLGNVGFQYDVICSNQILTHSKGILKAARFHDLEIEITGVDPVLQKRQLFEEKVDHAKAYASLNLLPKKQFDLVIFSCSTSELVKVILESQEIISFPRAIVEKPVATTLGLYKSLDQNRSRDIEIKVGFPRRTLPSSNYLREILQKEPTKSLYNVKLQIGGDILNIGSHFLDLIHFLFGSFEIDDYWNKGNFVRLRASNPILNLLVEQNSYENNEQSTFSVEGPLNFTYKLAGRRIEFCDLDLMNAWIYDATSEIQGMLGFEAIDYIGWAAKGIVSSLPALDENPIRKLLERMK